MTTSPTEEISSEPVCEAQLEAGAIQLLHAAPGAGRVLVETPGGDPHGGAHINAVWSSLGTPASPTWLIYSSRVCPTLDEYF